MATPVKILPHYTYNDYVQWEGKWELIDGIPFAMSPAPIPKHQIVAANLSAEFRFALKSCRQCKVMQPVDYKIDESTVFQPDMLVVCRPIEKKFLDFPPVLVAEVLSPSTLLIDRNTKFHAYQKQQIPYYLIISPETEETELYRLENGAYELTEKAVALAHTFLLAGTCSATIDFGEIWK